MRFRLLSCLLGHHPPGGHALNPKYKATPTAEERQRLRDPIASGEAAARKLAHARIPLEADAAEGGPAWPDPEVAEAVGVGTDTVGRARQRLVERGFEAALARRPRERPSRPRPRDGRAEARPIELACSAPPDGQADWAMQPLADRLVELGVVPAASDEAVRRAPKEAPSSRARATHGASRRIRTPSSWRRWRTCSTSTIAPTTRSGR